MIPKLKNFTIIFHPSFICNTSMRYLWEMCQTVSLAQFKHNFLENKNLEQIK